MKYFDELVRAMTWLGEKSNTIFLGQSVEYSGHAMFNTLKDVSMDKRLECPVAEEMQMGITLGLCLEGFVPVSIYPRFDFLILATNQLINHIDKTYEISGGKLNPNPIIRVSVGSTKPLFPGLQHSQNHTEAFRSMATRLRIITLEEPEQVFPAFQEAYEGNRPTLLVEYGDFYNEK
jgi:pyruvate/2-oxoglutarate/acetoin dehydrogenase E1 component